MRAADTFTESLVTLKKLGDIVPEYRPLPPVRAMVNRKQLRDCAGLLGKLVPLIIGLMLDHPTVVLGQACYPVLEVD